MRRRTETGLEACAESRHLRKIAHTRISMPAAPAIVVDHLVKAYRNVIAVDDISFSLAPGSITGLLGGNGAGKTTTIAMIMGLVIDRKSTRLNSSHLGISYAV